MVGLYTKVFTIYIPFNTQYCTSDIVLHDLNEYMGNAIFKSIFSTIIHLEMK